MRDLSGEDRMKAAVFNDIGELAVVERSLPDPKPGWVRLAITTVGICGSDLNLLYAHHGSSRGVQPGHEVAGVIDVVGDGVALKTGTAVALEPLVGCGTCRFCRTGLHNLCPDVRLCGFTRPGGMAEFLTVPADALYALPPALPSHIAALSEPMAVCVRGARLARLVPGERVAILGAGSIGLLSILAARAAGAGEVLITARHPHQQALAHALGANDVFDSAQSLLAAVGPQHVDVVIETVGGRADTLAESVRVARNGGRIVLLGVFDGEPTLPGMALFQKELTIHASNCYGRECHHPDFAVATDLVARYRDPLEPLVTHRFKLDQVARAFATAADKSTHSIKVQIEP
jgi:threonine dehydrogenase-like Zn-dependent dehydrogenase